MALDATSDGHSTEHRRSFRTIGGVAPGFTRSLNQEITTAFSARQIPLVENQPNLVLHGTVEKRQDGLHLTPRSTTRTRRPCGAGRRFSMRSKGSPHMFSARACRSTLDCVLDRLARERRPANTVLSMFIQACYGSGNLDGQLLDEGRRMAASDPQFTGGWWAIAEGANDRRPWFG